jgi:uncharacterized membrane protein YphA (DoxX/SURF4 family)
MYGPDSSIPLPYQQVITAFCKSGFFKMVGAFQVLCGLLILIPRTRVLGLMMLLPLIYTIFMIHLFLDNRPGELVETGIPMLATVVILAPPYSSSRTSKVRSGSLKRVRSH